MQEMQTRLIYPPGLIVDNRSDQPGGYSLSGRVPPSQQLNELSGYGVLAEVGGTPRNELSS